MILNGIQTRLSVSRPRGLAPTSDDAACPSLKMVDARANTMTRGFILVLATGPYVQQGVHEHCIILHQSAYSRGVQARREMEGSS